MLLLGAAAKALRLVVASPRLSEAEATRTFRLEPTRILRLARANNRIVGPSAVVAAAGLEEIRVISLLASSSHKANVDLETTAASRMTRHQEMLAAEVEDSIIIPSEGLDDNI